MQSKKMVQLKAVGKAWVKIALTWSKKEDKGRVCGIFSV